MFNRLLSITCGRFSALILALCLCSCGSSDAPQQVNQSNKAEEVEANSPDAEGFKSIFDGKTLTGWEGDPTYWRVEDGNLVGEIVPATVLKTNSFIIWQGGQPADFELKLQYRITEMGNSGINYRSTRIDTLPYALRGYQCDIDGRNRYTGQNYEEKKRTTLAYHGQKTLVKPQPNNPGFSFKSNIEKNAWQSVEVQESFGDRDSLNTFIRSNDWNEVHIVSNKNRMLHYVNNVLMSDVTDNDTVNLSLKGFIGVQVHVGPPMKVEYKNIRIKEL